MVESFFVCFWCVSDFFVGPHGPPTPGAPSPGLPNISLFLSLDPFSRFFLGEGIFFVELWSRAADFLLLLPSKPPPPTLS